tara:strand:- start:719 stop:913 length:195 start_codon:yes stop_codon:yes gene_type:complete
MFGDDFNPDGVRASPAERKRRLEKQQKWRRAADLRARWTPDELAAEEDRLHREVNDMLEARRAA